jgi:Ca2+-binding RTX toxin-like protein
MASGRLRLCLAAAVGILGFAAWPAHAPAGVASVEERLLIYNAADGEQNDVRIAFDGTVTVVRDSAGVTAGPGCTPTDRGDSVRCDVNFYIDLGLFFSRKYIRVLLRDGNDRAAIADPGPGKVGPGAVLDGGSGDDLLRGGSGNNEFSGGDGNDMLIGGRAVNRFLEGPQGGGSDTLVVRSGHAWIRYVGRRNPVSVTLDGRANDGEAGEGDRVRVGSFARRGGLTIEGGEAGDHLQGTRGNDVLVGGPGADTLRGEGGDDVLLVSESRSGAIVRTGKDRAADRADGGPGPDILWGNQGPNRLAGGPGRDTIVAGGGDDTLDARDGEADDVGCGPGFDRALLDPLDFWRNGRDACERPRRPVAATAAFAGLDSDDPFETLIGTQRTADAYVGCPGDAPTRCVGAARVVRGAIVLGSTWIDIARNRTPLVFIRINATGRRLVKAHGRLRVALEVESRDRRGVWRRTRATGLRLEYIDPADVDYGPEDP